MTNNELLDTPIAELQAWGLSIKVINALEERLGAIYVREALGLTSAEFLSIPNAGAKQLRELRTALKSFLRGDSPIYRPHELISQIDTDSDSG